MNNQNFLQRLNLLRNEVSCPKSHYNEFGGYHHRNLEDIFNAIKELSVKYNITILVSDKLISLGDSLIIEATATAYDALGCGAFVNSVGYAKIDVMRKKLDACQLTGVASSYARKYALSALLCLDDVKDSDNLPPLETPRTPSTVEPTDTVSEHKEIVKTPSVSTTTQHKIPSSLKRTKSEFVLTYNDGSSKTANVNDVANVEELLKEWRAFNKKEQK